LKPAVDDDFEALVDERWMFWMYSEASFGTTDFGATAFRSGRAGRRALERVTRV